MTIPVCKKNQSDNNEPPTSKPLICWTTEDIEDGETWGFRGNERTVFHISLPKMGVSISKPKTTHLTLLESSAVFTAASFSGPGSFLSIHET